MYMSIQIVTIVSIISIISAASGLLLTRSDLRPHFEHFKRKFEKIYIDETEELRRLDIFVENVNWISAQNLKADLAGHHFRLGINQFADKTNEEFKQLFLNENIRGSGGGRRRNFKPRSHEQDPLPSAVDWRSQNMVTPVADQNMCSAGWAFAAAAALEGQHANVTGELVPLSVQNLIDCSRDEGNVGCRGGFMDFSFNYIGRAGGLDTEESYPYRGAEGTCQFQNKTIGASLSSWLDLPDDDEDALTEAIATVGPVAVRIDASTLYFQFYAAGILFDPDCSSTVVNHGMAAVGYGVEEVMGIQYYIVKNSWGFHWGMGGYVWMAREGKNQCGIAASTGYPIV